MLKFGWYTLEIIVTYNKCRRCRRKESYVKDNRGQGVLQNKTFWYGCRRKKKEKAAWPRETEAQQSSTWPEEPESTTREGGSRKEVRRTFKILRKVWLNIRVEKIDTHEGVIIKVLLDSVRGHLALLR